MRLMLLGGHDTTAATVSWILDLITQNPAELRKLEDTVRAGSDEYLTAVVQESLRLRPVFPFTVRLAKQPLEFDGLTIPAGTLVVPVIALVHRRPDIYPARRIPTPSSDFLPGPSPGFGSGSHYPSIAIPAPSALTPIIFEMAVYLFVYS